MGLFFRRVLTLDGAGRVALQDAPIPPLEPGQLLVEVRASCISPGTELGSVPERRASPDTGATARPFGYSNAGVVLDRGPGCDDIPLDLSVACMGGGYALHTTHAIVPRNMAVPIPQRVSWEAAATNHLAATGLHAVRRGEFTLGEHVAVYGLGIVGFFTAQLAAMAGSHVLGVDGLALRRDAVAATGWPEATASPFAEDFAQTAGAFSQGHGFDGGVIAFGGDGTPALKSLVGILKQAPDTHKMGRVVVVGGARIDHVFAAALGNVDVRSSARPGPGYHDKAWEHGQDYPPVFVPWTTRRNIEECLRWMALGRLKTDPLITHRVPLSQGPDICDLLVDHPEQALGVILLPD
jgi:threonine dehydrogenase-like Zn-dependent dehydrogenase